MLLSGLELEDSELLHEAENSPELPGLDDLSDDVLRELTASRGIDFATALLYCRICNSLRYAPFIEFMKQGLSEPNGAHLPPKSATTIGIVPAIYDNKHREHESSGDFLLNHVEQLGYRAVIVPVPPVRTIGDGAEIILDWLRNQDERTILMSLSIGSAEAKLALRQPNATSEFRNLAAWVNVTGPMTGSPLINSLERKRFWWFLLNTLMRLRGRKSSMLSDLKYGPETVLWEPLDLPADLAVYHLMGFPLPRHFRAAITSSSEKFWWKMVRWLRLSEYGPHEGVGVLASLLREPGLIYPVWGVPHWLGPRWNILSVISRILEHIELPRSPEISS